jgi:hypothetical protein
MKKNQKRGNKEKMIYEPTPDIDMKFTDLVRALKEELLKTDNQADLREALQFLQFLVDSAIEDIDDLQAKYT